MVVVKISIVEEIFLVLFDNDNDGNDDRDINGADDKEDDEYDDNSDVVLLDFTGLEETSDVLGTYTIFSVVVIGKLSGPVMVVVTIDVDVSGLFHVVVLSERLGTYTTFMVDLLTTFKEFVE